MKLNKCFLFMLILICSLINISGNNSPIGIGESSNDSKRALEEQIDNYIILQFNQDVSYEGGEFLCNYGPVVDKPVVVYEPVEVLKRRNKQMSVSCLARPDDSLKANQDEQITYDYNQYISYIINGDEILDRNSTFIVKNNT